MIDCPNVEMRDHLPDLANETLGAAERAAVQAHVESCADCRAELDLIRSMRAALHWSTPRMDVALIAAAIPRPLTPALARPAAPRRSWGGQWRVAAAIAVLAAGLGSYSLLGDRAPGVIDSISGAAPQGMALTGALADLSDSQLEALVRDLEQLEALPSTEIEIPVTVGGSAVPDSVLYDLEGL